MRKKEKLQVKNKNGYLQNPVVLSGGLVGAEADQQNSMVQLRKAKDVVINSFPVRKQSKIRLMVVNWRSPTISGSVCAPNFWPHIRSDCVTQSFRTKRNQIKERKAIVIGKPTCRTETILCRHLFLARK